MKTLLMSVLALTLINNSKCGGVRTNYTAYLIHAEPYAWTNGTKVTGLIPDLLNILAVKCEELQLTVKQVHWSLEELKEVSLSDDPLTLIAKKENISRDDVGKNTIIGMNNFNAYFEKKGTKFLAYPFVQSRGIVGVVHRDTIGLGRKLYEAMLDSSIIMYNGLLLAAIVGVLIWCLERKENSQMFPKSIGHGILNGIWCSFVTMATVGYGDIVPKTKLGKSLMLFYMCVATLLIAALTGVYTERVSNSELTLAPDLKMSVVNGTYDVEIAMRLKKNRGHVIDSEKVIKTRTYLEALDLVQNKEVEVTLIDYNVAAWLQEDIIARDLRITKFIQQKFHLHIYLYEDHTEHDRIHRLTECFRKNQNYFEHAMDNFVRPIDFVKLDITDMYYALSNVGITPVMSCIFVLTFSLVMVYEVYVLRRRRLQKTTVKDGGLFVEKERILTLQLLEKKLDEKFNGIKEEILRDYSELMEESNIFFESSLNNTQRSDLFRLQ